MSARPSFFSFLPRLFNHRESATARSGRRVTSYSPHHSWPVGRLLFPVYNAVARRLRTNPLLIRYLFRVRLPMGVRPSWDWTTLALRRALAARIVPGLSVLEIGVGEGALLAIYLTRAHDAAPDGVDILMDRVRSSQIVAHRNSASLRIWQSDLFDNVEGTYDLVYFNAAYIPTEFGETQDLTRRGGFDDPRAWDGGSDGTETVVRFLAAAPQFLNPHGEALLGVNNFYVPDARMSEIIRASRLSLVKRYTIPLNPSSAYLLRRREDSDAP